MRVFPKECFGWCPGPTALPPSRLSSRSRPRAEAQDGGIFAASRGGEVSLRNLSPADRAKFDASDAKEWEAMKATGA
eukprot:9487734-Pyramimonas_sp.AAC.1